MHGFSIDTTFDVRSDANGRDPDSHSPTLRRYHRLLWSKPLPSGAVLALSDAVRGEYLVHDSGLGRFVLASDSIVHTLAGFRGTRAIIEQIPADEIERFDRISYTIGGMTLFPGNRIDGRPTINGARGMHPGIRDRIDLTLECIRRHYMREVPNPLGAVLDRYADFFRLFESFRGYVDFFLLQDLVTPDGSAVRFATPFADFPTSPLPKTLEEYEQYRDRMIEFVTARNARMAAFAAQ